MRYTTNRETIAGKTFFNFSQFHTLTPLRYFHSPLRSIKYEKLKKVLTAIVSRFVDTDCNNLQIRRILLPIKLS